MTVYMFAEYGFIGDIQKRLKKLIIKVSCFSTKV